jgi:hypothetical protein
LRRCEIGKNRFIDRFSTKFLGTEIPGKNGNSSEGISKKDTI